eukprot:CAMPEP_0196726712 /NCGR_PEP_ID=MMETSP1091-20130531/7912_1 /TAXON_ID=302021 /ORGANISM="Rhodomonas sp., Strain CCMP768" /LENGTH=305 /DNA_ID=CAMNT_0042069195 /DNA_START=85 /DNA_END=1003 /DNA_ORIENTATION=+
MGAQLSMDRFMEQALDCDQCRCFDEDKKRAPQSNHSGTRVPVQWMREYHKIVADDHDMHRDLQQSGATELHKAAAHGDVNRVRECLCNGFKVNALDDAGRTPFYLACKYGKGTTARELLKLGANMRLGQKALDDDTVPERIRAWLAKLEKKREPAAEDFMEYHTYEGVLSGLAEWNGKVKSPAKERAAKAKAAEKAAEEAKAKGAESAAAQDNDDGNNNSMFSSDTDLQRVNPQLGPDTVRLLRLSTPQQGESQPSFVLQQEAAVTAAAKRWSRALSAMASPHCVSNLIHHVQLTSLHKMGRHQT